MFTKKSVSRVCSVLFVLVLMLALAGPAKAAEAPSLGASSIVVDSTSDTVANDKTCTLREAIINANNNDQSGSLDCAAGISGEDTINFDLSYPALITLTSELPLITEDLVIGGPFFGNELSISGDKSYRILSIYKGVSLSLGNLSLIWGYASGGHGGAINNAIGNLSVTDCVFNNNTASGSGGAIHNDAGSLTVIRTDFYNNTASYGGAIDNGEGSLSVSNSHFEDNSAGDGGGAINNYQITDTQTVEITTSTFQTNTAVYGGAVRSDGGTHGTLGITDSTFIGNTASNEAGAVNNYQGAVNITNSTFSGNSATTNGGSLSNSAGTLTVINSTFVSSNSISSGTLRNFSGNVVLKNTILANSGGDNCQNSDSLSSGPDNIALDDSCVAATQTTLANLKLGSLANHGGNTKTIALLSGSVALDAGNNTTCAAAPVNNLDQRGITRPQGLQCDVGAFEKVQVTGILRAKPGGTTSGICDTWANACDLQYALYIAESVSEIWVKAGTYTPTSGTDRTATFQLKNGVALYGGFAGTETARNVRNPGTNVTTLSGDLSGNDSGFTNNGENSYHVVTGSGTDATAILDGFTITGGNANNSSDPNNIGGGMYNSGGSPTLTNLTFSSNHAGWGGGMMNSNSSPTMTNVSFKGNAVTYDGGGMQNNFSNPSLTNVTFKDNSATNGGGGMNNYYSTPTLINVTFNGNSASSGGAIGNDNSDAIIHNSIVWGNVPNGSQIAITDSTPTITYSDIEGGYTGTGNINVNPLFGIFGNYGGSTQIFPLQTGSPAIDAGDNADCPATDQRGVTRPLDGNGDGTATCDMGAYEAIATYFKSSGSQDGWILESSETSGHGGSMSASATTLRLGDNAAKKQYRSILSFSTGASLPDTAIITKVTLKVRKQGIIGGGNPITTFQGFMVDIKKGYFGTTALQTADFQTAGSKTYGPFKPALSSGWYSIDLTSGKNYINKLSSYSGLTQIRLRFKLDDNNNTTANYLSLYSGNAGTSYRPQLIIEYYIP
jgi:CSLREA domain-containing protein